MIYVHPTLIQKPFELSRLKNLTGTIERIGKNYYRLVPRETVKNMQHQRSRPLVICTRCDFCCNTQNVDEKCSRCRVGTMVYPDNGGSAA